MDLRLGPALHDRVRAVADKFGRSMASVVEAADRSWDKRMQGVTIEIANKTATAGRSPLTVKCDRDPAELRAIIDWYITPYEELEPDLVYTPSEELIQEMRIIETGQQKVALMQTIAETKVKMMELEAGIVT